MNIGIKVFILMLIFMLFLGTIKKVKGIRWGVLGVVFFLGSYCNMKNYEKDIVCWKDIEENKEVVVNGYVDEIIEKTNIVYIYVDDVLILVDIESYNDVCVGNYVEIRGFVKHFQTAKNEGNFNEELYYYSLGFTKKIEAQKVYIIDNKKDVMREIVGKFRSKYISSVNSIWGEVRSGIINALTVGYKDDLEEDIKDRYKLLGISHVLAISGLHLSIIGMGIFKLLRRRFNYWISGICGIIVILIFGVMIGDSPSIYRATIMFVMHIIAIVIGRTYDMISATSLAAVMLMADCPYVIYNTGFVLSFGAIIAICIVSTVIEITNIFAVTGVIQIFTLPVTMMLFYEIPLYSVLINIIVIPTVGVLVVSGLLSGIVGMYSFGLGVFVSGIGRLILWFYDALYDIVSSLPFNNLVTGKAKVWLMIVYYLLVLALVFFVYIKKKSICLWFSVVFVFLLLFFNVDSTFYFCAIDVGQGDCLIVHNKDDSVYMIDAGSSDVSGVYEYRIKSALKAKGIDRIDGFIVTHLDGDHMNAVTKMLEEGLIDNLYLPNISTKGDTYVELEEVAKKAGTKVNYLSAGMLLEDGDMRMRCLYPFVDSVSEDINELSVVLKIEYGDYSVLCTGDLGIDGERELIDRYPIDMLDCDVLKVGHHGSKYSSCTEFLRIVSPEVAVISCGENNSYGHPHEEVLERLAEVGSKVISTMERGEVIVRIPD